MAPTSPNWIIIAKIWLCGLAATLAWRTGRRQNVGTGHERQHPAPKSVQHNGARGRSRQYDRHPRGETVRARRPFVEQGGEQRGGRSNGLGKLAHSGRAL